MSTERGSGRLTVVDEAAPVVAVVGRPNVGKSTLVNRLVGRREAIVEERPGVTRDRTTHEVDWRGHRLVVVDTGGWTPGWSREHKLDDAVSAQAETAVARADLVVLVVDLHVGITEEDAAFVDWLRRSEVDAVVVANKADTLGGPAVAAGVADLYGLGVGDPVPVSALHGRGAGDLLDVIVERLTAAEVFERAAPTGDHDAPPGIALIGRPNVGKSSLFNRVLGAERAIVDDAPGTTRDAVDTVVATPDGRRYRFVDTAGLRRKAKPATKRKTPSTEYYSTLRTVAALENAAVALLVIDAAEPIGEQEQRLARQVVDAGRGLLLVCNKWDRVDEERREQFAREVDRLLGFVAWAPLIRTSATTGRGINRLLPAVDAVLDEWNKRVPTAVLNDWLADAVAANPPPLTTGHRAVKLRYATQVAVGPPTVRVFGNVPVSSSYRRYLERTLREQFGFTGTPLHVTVRGRDDRPDPRS